MNGLSIPEKSARLTSRTDEDATLLRAATEMFAGQASHDRDSLRRFEDVVSHLLPRVGTAERRFVSERLAGRHDAPVPILRMLARDAIEIAGPILRGSPVLGSFDLLTVIAATGPAHHRLIAGRAGLDEDVVRALRLAGDPDMLRLLEGRDAASPAGAPLPDRSVVPETLDTGREAGSMLRSARDPWIFLTLDGSARLAVLRDAATGLSRTHPAEAPRRPEEAFRSILGAAQAAGLARRRDRATLARTLAENLGLALDLVFACLDDEGGEALAILLRALPLDSAQARQVMLLASPAGQDTERFFKLCDLFGAMELHVAEALVAAWSREDPARPAIHRQHYADTEERNADGRPQLPAERKQSEKRA